eukprot:UN03935
MTHTWDDRQGIWILDEARFGGVNITECEVLEDAIENIGDGSIPTSNGVRLHADRSPPRRRIFRCQFDAAETGDVVMYSQYVYCTDLVPQVSVLLYKLCNVFVVTFVLSIVNFCSFFLFS